MMSTVKKPTDAQWHVRGHSHPASGGARYVLRNAKTGQFKTVSSSAKTTVVMEKLAKDKIKMLKRLADR